MVEVNCEMWSVVEDETTDGKRCFVSYDLMLDGCMAQGETPEEAFINLQSARYEFKRHDR